MCKNGGQETYMWGEDMQTVTRHRGVWEACFLMRKAHVTFGYSPRLKAGELVTTTELIRL